MTYSVEITASAEAELAEAYRYIRNEAPDRAEAWRRGFYDAAESLKCFPLRCNLAPENQWKEFEVRQLLYSSHRILFTIVRETVFVLHIRRTARRTLSADDMEVPPSS